MGLLERQREFTGYLVKGFPEYGLVGWSFVGSCAVTGNGSVENNMLPVTTGPKDHGSDAVLQWREDRLDGPNGLKAWARTRDLPWDTLRTQAAFTLWETKKDYPLLDKDLREGKKSIEVLTEDFMNVFERPSRDPSVNRIDLRKRHAKSVYLVLKDEFVSPIPAVIGAGAGGAVVAGGTVAATTGDPMQSIVAALLSGAISAVSWYIAKRKGVNNVSVPEPESIQPPAPLTISASPTADLDAAKEAAVAAFNKLLDEQKKARAKVAELQAAIDSAGIVIEQATKILPERTLNVPG